MITYQGTCPVCAGTAGFAARNDWFRDELKCRECGSIPRERIFAWALDLFRPDWRSVEMHECSPAERAVSRRMAEQCPGYVGSQFFADVPRGEMRGAMRSEDIEALTFPDQSLDLHVHLDVMEHVNRPDRALREMCRTLRPGGMAIFTTPFYPGLEKTLRRAIRFEDGIEHLGAPEYHGNPISDEGALVTFHYGRDLNTLMRMWEPNFSITQLIPEDPSIGAMGDFRDVFVLRRIG